MKLIFLDIDGVLNSTAWSHEKRNHEERHHEKPAREAQAAIKDALSYWKRSLDPKAVERVNRIWQETGAAVVVSSSWRTMLKPQELIETLVAAGLRADFDGITPDLYDFLAPPAHRATRWQEIALCITTRGKWTEQFVILDDDPMPDAPAASFVRTDYKIGLTDADADRAIAILTQ